MFLCLSVLSCLSVSYGSKIDVQHNVVITNKGTRSEGKWGNLLINSNKVPPVFSKIVVAETPYFFIIRNNLWTKGGYWPAKEKESIGYIDKSLSVEQQEKGWYRGTLLECREGTPDFWIWIHRKDVTNFSYWVNPLKLDKFISYFELKAIDSIQAGPLKLLEDKKSMRKS